METVGDDNPIAHCQPIRFNPSKTVAPRRKNLKEKKMASPFLLFKVTSGPSLVLPSQQVLLPGKGKKFTALEKIFPKNSYL